MQKYENVQIFGSLPIYRTENRLEMTYKILYTF